MRSSRRRSGSSASSVQAHTRHSRGAPFGALRFVSGASGADGARASCAFRLCRSGRPVSPGRAASSNQASVASSRLAAPRPTRSAWPSSGRLTSLVRALHAWPPRRPVSRFCKVMCCKFNGLAQPDRSGVAFRGGGEMRPGVSLRHPSGRCVEGCRVVPNR